MEEERLELEKQKAERAKETGIEDGMYGIVIMPEVALKPSKEADDEEEE